MAGTTYGKSTIPQSESKSRREPMAWDIWPGGRPTRKASRQPDLASYPGASRSSGTRQDGLGADRAARPGAVSTTNCWPQASVSLLSSGNSFSVESRLTALERLRIDRVDRLAGGEREDLIEHHAEDALVAVALDVAKMRRAHHVVHREQRVLRV